MSWIFLAIGVLISSVSLYSFVRVAKTKNISINTLRMSINFIPAIFFIAFNIFQKNNFFLPLHFMLLIIFVAIFFSYYGNLFSIKGIQNAPNPGYSLIISKSSVVLSTLLSVLLLKAPITKMDVISIATIILGSAIVIYEKKTNKSNSIWLGYTFGAFISWALMAVSYSYLVKQGVPSIIILAYGYSVVSIILITKVRNKFEVLQEFNLNKWLLIGCGFSSMIFNYCLVEGYKVAPNPGFMNAASMCSICLVTIFSAIFFKDQLDKRKLFGILVTSVGVASLFIF